MSSDAGLTRRQTLQLGALAAGSLTYAGKPAHPHRDRSFDDGWLFLLGDATGAGAPGFDDRRWRALDLPHDWGIEDLPYAISDDGGATADPSLLTTQVPPATPVPPPVIGPFDPARSAGGGSTGYTVGGIGWYRKHFRPVAAERTELRFDGVYVCVDNSGLTSRWYSGSGIYRHTWLTLTGATRVPFGGVVVTTPSVDARRASVRVTVETDGQAPDRIRVTLLDPSGHVVARASSAPGAGRPT